MPIERIWTLITRKLSGEANQSELQELEELLLQDPQAAKIMAELSNYWQSPTPTDKDYLEATYLLHLNRMKEAGHQIPGQEEPEPTTRPKSRRRLVYTLIALPILIAGALYLGTPASTPSPVTASVKALNEVHTRSGAKSQMTLPDGTQVWLNSNTKLTYGNDFNGDQREVVLEGEAYFDVVHNAGKPFIIHTQKMDIKVLGTAFNVRAYKGENVAEATLLRGSIEVILKDRKNQNILLKPNEKISISTASEPTNTGKPAELRRNSGPAIPQVEIREIQYIPVLNLAEDVAWKENKLYFKDQNLGNIAVQLERWFGKKVEIRDESLKDLRFTGNFENETLEEVLTAMQISSPFSFRVTGNTVEISK